MSQDKHNRKQRIPLGAQRIKGAVSEKDPRYHYHWINDQPGRIQMALDGGYELVPKSGVIVNKDANTNLGSMVSQYAGRNEAGVPFNRYLMRIRKTFYDEDQAAKADLNDEVDKAILAGKFKRNASNYVPKSGIKMNSGPTAR